MTDFSGFCRKYGIFRGNNGFGIEDRRILVENDIFPEEFIRFLAMNDELKRYSFMNNLFVFQKV